MSYQVQIIIQVVLGLIFILDGVVKFVVPELGYERFATLGLPLPIVLAPIFGSIEIIGGGLLLYDLHTKEAISALLILTLGALIFTKVPILISDGFTVTLHHARLEIIVTTLLSLLLIIKIRQLEKEEIYV